MNALEAIKKTAQKLESRRNSDSTRQSYLCELKQFFHYFEDIQVEDINIDMIKQYLQMFARARVSDSKLNLAINAIKYFYENILERDRFTVTLDRPLKRKSLPVVLSPEEYLMIIKSAKTIFKK